MHAPRARRAAHLRVSWHYLTVRDDFTKETQDALAKRVGVRCSNPLCRKVTTGPRSDPAKIVNIGVAAHITAAAAGGPRFDAALAPEQRRAPENGIWLCQNCAKLVDNDPDRYIVESLRAWKARAEAAALEAIEGLAEGQESPGEDAIEMEFLYKMKGNGDRHDYLLRVLVRNLGTDPLVDFHVDLEFPFRAVEKADAIPSYVSGRSNKETAVFRAIYRGEVQAVFPGDENSAIELPYYMDQKLFMSRGNLFGSTVRATLYRNALRPLAIEKPFAELQCF